MYIHIFYVYYKMVCFDGCDGMNLDNEEIEELYHNSLLF
jgi:hypothetical protein